MKNVDVCFIHCCVFPVFNLGEKMFNIDKNEAGENCVMKFFVCVSRGIFSGFLQTSSHF